MAEQVCITKDNTQLGVDGIIYYQVTDPKLASYGSSNYIDAVTQLAQTTLRSEIGKMELDKTFESRDEVNRQVVSVLDEAKVAAVLSRMTPQQRLTAIEGLALLANAAMPSRRSPAPST